MVTIDNDAATLLREREISGSHQNAKMDILVDSRPVPVKSQANKINGLLKRCLDVANLL